MDPSNPATNNAAPESNAPGVAGGGGARRWTGLSRALISLSQGLGAGASRHSAANLQQGRKAVPFCIPSAESDFGPL